MPGGQKTKQPQAEQVQQAPEAKAAQQTQQAPEIEQSAKEEVPGVKPEEYAAQPQEEIPPLGSFDTPDIIKAREEQKTIPETNLINTPERQALREQVARNLLDRGSFVGKDQAGKDVFGGPVENNKIVDIVIGLPASGKSSFVHAISKETKSLVIDADEAKPFLGDIRHSGATHKESGDIVDNMVTPEMIDRDYNVILPIVGKNIERVRKLRDMFHDKGYQVYLHLIDLSPEKATRRAVERFQNTGRFVDPNYVLNLGLIPSKNYDILKKEKGWAGYEKYSTDVERGQPPVLIERGGELSANAGRSLRLSRRGLSQGSGEGIQGKGQETSAAEVGIPQEITTSQTYITPQQSESVKQKPDIRLMPSLKGFVDTGKLSIEDALEIDDVARQNSWSDDTVKQFYKGAVEGLGVQNKDTASLEQMLVTAKIKSAVYKQNAEQYKQELAETESQIERLSKLLKIEGGAPGKYEAAANDFLKNLGDLKNLKPEEIIRKAQEEFALNLNRIDTGIDVKTLITAAVKTINEAEGISKEVVTHEQTVQEALKELPGIYNNVLDMKRGKALTRPQQLAARMMGAALFETFNKTKMGLQASEWVKLSSKLVII